MPDTRVPRTVGIPMPLLVVILTFVLSIITTAIVKGYDFEKRVTVLETRVDERLKNIDQNIGDIKVSLKEHQQETSEMMKSNQPKAR